MTDQAKLKRRDFLRLSALAAGGALLAACSQQPAATDAPAPTTAPDATAEPTAPVVESTKVSEPTVVAVAQYTESPMLAEMVAQGKLPPVDERLPENPRVAKHGWQTPGKYGGYMQLSVGFEWGLTYFPAEQFAYGSSPLQYKDDGLRIEPGTCESWDFNAEATELTLHYRKGLKWSDGTPWTTKDFMFWWNDMVLDPDHGAEAPSGFWDGAGNRVEVVQVDDFTVKIKYSVPTPLALDQIAMNIKGLWGGSDWMGVPEHYFKNLHPKYNAEMADFAKFDEALAFFTNPDVPTLNAWKVKKYEQGQRIVWERNPFYYVVDEEGSQLPFLDGFVNTNYMNADVEKLAWLEGKVDFGQFGPFGLPEIPTVKDSYETSKVNVYLWSFGSGTGPGFVFNQDYHEEKYRKLFNDPRFLKALSHACNREEYRKVHTLGYGDLTTGTMSSRAIEFNIDDSGRSWYQQWRDNAVAYDPAKAAALLDELGLKDVDGDGLREFADGSKMELTLDYQGAQGDLIPSIELMDRDWKAAGLNTRLNPVPPDSFNDLFISGKIMGYGNYDAADGPNCILFPAHIVPSGTYGWAPMQGYYYGNRKSEAGLTQKDVDPWERNPAWREPDPGSPIAKLQELLDQSYLEPDAMKRYQLVYEMVKIHIESGPFMIGVVADVPTVVLCKADLKNVPTDAELKLYALGGFTGPWIIPTPGTYDPETWYFENPEAHMI
jgi:peptide/nickel transport system substrate-binding protein